MMVSTIVSRPLHTSTMLGFTLLSLAAQHSRGGGGSRLGSYNGISLHYQGRQVGFPRGEERLSYSRVNSYGPPNMTRRKQTRRKHHGSPLALQPEPEFFVSRYSFLQPLAEGTQSPYQLHSLCGVGVAMIGFPEKEESYSSLALVNRNRSQITMLLDPQVERSNCSPLLPHQLVPSHSKNRRNHGSNRRR